MSDSSDLGCAVRSDGSLKDASEIEWHYDEDDESLMAPVSSTSSTSGLPAKVHPFFTGHPAPAKMVAGSRRSARALRPSARVLDPNNAMNKSASSSALNPSTANGKRKAPPSPPSRRIARKVDTDSGDECDADTSIAELSSQPKLFEALQILKSAYRNGHITAPHQAAQHVDVLIALQEELETQTDDELED